MTRRLRMPVAVAGGREFGRARARARRPWWAAWLAAVGCVAVAMVAREALAPALGGHAPFVTFSVAAVAVTWLAGWRAGAATVVAGLLLWWFRCFVAPGASPPGQVEVADAVLMASFVAYGLIAVAVSTGARRHVCRARRMARALRESEERFRILVELCPDAVFVHQDGRIVFANAAAGRMFGGSAAAGGGLIGRSPLDLVHPDHREAVRARIARLAAGAETNPVMELRMLRLNDGDGFDCEASAARVPWAGRVGIEVIVRDVTRRKAAEEALRQLAQRLHQHRENSPLGVVEFDADGRIAGWNHEAERMFGWSAAEAMGRRIDDLRWVYEEDAERVRRVMDELRGEAYPCNVVPNRNYRKDGSVIHCEWYNSAVTDARGRVVSIVSQALDVTARVRAERAVADREARLRMLVEQMPAVVWTTDADLRIVSGRAGGGAADGLSARSMGSLGMTLPELFGTADPTFPAIAAHRRALLGEASSYEMEWDGVVFHATVEPLRGADGAIVGVIGVAVDVTARKRAEEALQRAKEAAEEASRYKDQFLAMLSHELRTPLNPVLLAAEELEADPGLSEPVREDVRMIHRNVELEVRLIDDLLDVARIATGKLTVRLRGLDVRTVLGETIRFCSADLGAKGLELRQEFEMAPHPARGDPTRLHQVFWNLLKNAIKFTPAGGRVTVRCFNDAARSVAVVEVEDTGVGIAADVLPRVFDPMEQGGSGVTGRFGGLGLGLAISKALVELHGGRIEARSGGVGKGSCFRVTLPLATGAEGGGGEESPAPPVGPSPSRAGRVKARVLLVEDDADTARTVARILRAAGYAVRAAASLAEALEMAGREEFDVLVSDIGLPDGSGLELMERLRRGAHPLKGIAVSGYGMEDDVRRSREAGFAEHLTKPVSMRELAAVIDRVAG